MGNAHSLAVTVDGWRFGQIAPAKIPGQVFSGNDMSGTSFNDYWMPSVLREFAGQARDEIVFELEMHDPCEVVNWGIYGCKVISDFCN